MLTSLKEHWSGLTVFLDDPRIPAGYNFGERLMRNPAVARSNYYGSGAEWAGRLATMMFSILATLTLWKINPRLWLTWYLESCAAAGGKNRPATSSHSCLGTSRMNVSRCLRRSDCASEIRRLILISTLPQIPLHKERNPAPPNGRSSTHGLGDPLRGAEGSRTLDLCIAYVLASRLVLSQQLRTNQRLTLQCNHCVQKQLQVCATVRSFSYVLGVVEEAKG